MKKLISAILSSSIAFAALSFNGCSVKNANKLVMATNATFPPYEFTDENNALTGIDIEIGKAIAEKLGKELEIKDLPHFDDILDGVEDNKYDFGLAAITVNEERKARVSFSNTYAKGIQVVIVKSGSEYSSFMEFYKEFDGNGTPLSVKSGIKIGVQKDTTGDSYSSYNLVDWGFGESNVKRYESGDEAVKALLSDEVTAVIIDDEPAKALVGSHEGLKILESAFADEDYAVIVSKDNNELLGKINDAIEELKKEGTLDSIIKKYIK